MKNQLKTKTLKGFIIFLVLMIILTFVSRMAYTNKMPRVTVTNIKKQAISHSVVSSGVLEPLKKTPVFVPEGLRISEIFVNNRDVISTGDVLLQLDKQYLSDKIRDLEMEMQSDIQNSDDAYTGNEKLPVFTQPGLRVLSVNVKPGDYIECGSVLMRLDFNFLCSFVNDLQCEIDSYEIELEGLYESGDDRAAEMLSNTIDEKKRKYEKYYSLVSESGVIYSNLNGVVTNIMTTAGAVTDDSAVILISSNAQLKYDYESKERRLAELKKILEKDGRIESEYSGVISEVFNKSGDMTSESAMCIISDTSKGLRFYSGISENDTKYLSVGDTVTINFRNGKKRIDECVISNISKNDIEQTYMVEIPVEDDELKIGEIGQLSTTVLSSETYSIIPVHAVTLITENSGYIFVVEESEGFLGPEYIVKKTIVRIEDRNDSYYGVAELGIDSDVKIVIMASENIADGKKVRLL